MFQIFNTGVEGVTDQMGYTVLLVEDNPHIMEINSEALMMEDYKVLEATDGRSCMELLKENEPDLVVLDIMLPDSDGLELCRKIKEMYDLPIIFLSALGENKQIIEGLRAGGDDYLPKPYDIGVLLARIEARLRDVQRQKRFVKYKGLRLDTVSMIGSICGEKEETDLLLTQKEFALLSLLVGTVGGFMNPEDLYRNVWGVGNSSADDHNVIYTTVSRLNKKLDSAQAGIRVVFQRGGGYGLEET